MEINRLSQQVRYVENFAAPSFGLRIRNHNQAERY